VFLAQTHIRSPAIAVHGHCEPFALGGGRDPVDHAICICLSALHGASVADVTGAAEWRGDGL